MTTARRRFRKTPAQIMSGPEVPHRQILLLQKLRVVGVATIFSAGACSANRLDMDTKSPTTSTLSDKATRVTGRLPPPLIQSIVRSRYPEIQRCYELGLAREPQLKGKITIRFVIERDGSVRRVRLVDSAVQDDEVMRCVVAEFYRLHFPEPNGGIVTVEVSHHAYRGRSLRIPRSRPPWPPPNDGFEAVENLAPLGFRG
jgi:hypothetical protein